MGAALGREGAPKQAGAVFGNLAADLQKLSDEQRRLLVAIGAGAGMSAVYSVPLGGALFALEVLRGTLALRLVLPALAASTIATGIAAAFGIRDAAVYDVAGLFGPARRRLSLGAPRRPVDRALVRSASCALIAWADRAKPTGWRRHVAPPLAFLAVGLVSIPFPEVLGNGQDVAELCSAVRSRRCR